MIVDAIDGSYCQGRPTLILAAIQGLLKSMARVDWAVEGTDRSGTIPADKVTSNISRIDIAAADA